MNVQPPHPIKTSELLEISVVIPTYNSSKYINTTIEKTVLALRAMKLSFELLIIDDCSTDCTIQTCIKLKMKFEELNIISLDRNQGQRNTTSIGYSIAKGIYVVTFDDDLQYSPEEIQLLYKKITNSNSYVVSGFSSYKEERTWYKTLKKSLLASFNTVFFPNYRESKYISSFKIYNKQALHQTGLKNTFYFWEISPYKISSIRVLKRTGLRIKSTYNLKAFTKLLAPLMYKIFSKIGFTVSAGSLLFAIILKNSMVYAITLGSLFLALFFMLLLYVEKNAFLKANYKSV